MWCREGKPVDEMAVGLGRGCHQKGLVEGLNEDAASVSEMGEEEGNTETGGEEGH